MAQKLKIHLPMQETQLWFLGPEDPLEKEEATHSCISAWEILWTEETTVHRLAKSWTQLSHCTHMHSLSSFPSVYPSIISPMIWHLQAEIYGVIQPESKGLRTRSSRGGRLTSQLKQSQRKGCILFRHSVHWMMFINTVEGKPLHWVYHSNAHFIWKHSQTHNN